VKIGLPDGVEKDVNYRSSLWIFSQFHFLYVLIRFVISLLQTCTGLFVKPTKIKVCKTSLLTGVDLRLPIGVLPENISVYPPWLCSLSRRRWIVRHIWKSNNKGGISYIKTNIPIKSRHLFLVGLLFQFLVSQFDTIKMAFKLFFRPVEPPFNNCTIHNPGYKTDVVLKSCGAVVSKGDQKPQECTSQQ